MNVPHRRYPLPQVEPWPSYSERFDARSLAELRELPLHNAAVLCLDQNSYQLDLTQATKTNNIAALAIAADRVVDAYFLAHREASKLGNTDDGELQTAILRPTQVDIYAFALLNALADLYKPDESSTNVHRGATDSKTPEEKSPEDIAFRLIKGARIANKHDERGLSSHPLIVRLQQRDALKHKAAKQQYQQLIQEPDADPELVGKALDELKTCQSSLWFKALAEAD